MASRDSTSLRAEAAGESQAERSGSPAGTGGQVTVYYDGACPLCSREIAFYRRLAGSGALRWVDINGAGPADLGPGLTCEVALERFHVRDEVGRLIVGAAAFTEIWRHLPSMRWLAWIARRPPVSWLLEPAYGVFLRIRPWLVRRASS